MTALKSFCSKVLNIHQKNQITTMVVRMNLQKVIDQTRKDAGNKMNDLKPPPQVSFICLRERECRNNKCLGRFNLNPNSKAAPVLHSEQLMNEVQFFSAWSHQHVESLEPENVFIVSLIYK